MTQNQKENYNKMLFTLRKIANDYQTPDQLKKNSGKQYGLDPDEAIELSYENIQLEAKTACKGIKPAK